MSLLFEKIKKKKKNRRGKKRKPAKINVERNFIIAHVSDHFRIEGGALPTYRAGDRGVASGRAAARAQSSRTVTWL